MTVHALFLTRYPAVSAGSRYRFYQYVPFLQSAGFTCVVSPYFSEAYIRALYKGSRGLRLLPHVLFSFLKRWRVLMRDLIRADVIILQYESLPYLPLRLEQHLFNVRARVIVDLDDAFTLNYERHANPFVRRLLGTKLPRIVAQSHAVIAANANVAAWARQFNSRVVLIPTSVDLCRYPAALPCRDRSARPTIGWIGTPITTKHLSLLAKPLRELRRRHDFILKIIGAPQFALDGVEMVNVDWSERSEVQELRTCDIGVMPLSVLGIGELHDLGVCQVGHLSRSDQFRFPTQHDKLGPLVGEQRLQPLIGNELDVAGTAPAQRGDKYREPLPPAPASGNVSTDHRLNGVRQRVYLKAEGWCATLERPSNRPNKCPRRGSYTPFISAQLTDRGRASRASLSLRQRAFSHLVSQE